MQLDQRKYEGHEILCLRRNGLGKQPHNLRDDKSLFNKDHPGFH